MSRRTVTVKGLRELEANLAKLTKATAKGVVRRVLKKAAEPMAAAASAKARKKTGWLGDLIAVGTKTTRKESDAGKIAYGRVLRSGGSQKAAREALAAAYKQNPKTFSRVLIGPSSAVFYAMWPEFGTATSPAYPYMRPAWDETQDRCLEIITTELGNEIDKAAARAAKRAAKSA